MWWAELRGCLLVFSWNLHTKRKLGVVFYKKVAWSKKSVSTKQKEISPYIYKVFAPTLQN
jgi:hypothetical protein